MLNIECYSEGKMENCFICKDQQDAVKKINECLEFYSLFYGEFEFKIVDTKEDTNESSFVNYYVSHGATKEEALLDYYMFFNPDKADDTDDTADEELPF